MTDEPIDLAARRAAKTPQPVAPIPKATLAEAFHQMARLAGHLQATVDYARSWRRVSRSSKPW